MINRLLDHGEEFAEAMRERMEEGKEEVTENPEAPEQTRTDGGTQEDTDETEEDELTGLEGFDEEDENESSVDETEQRLNGMENRVEDVEESIDEVRSSVRKMEEKQDEVSDSIDEIDERMRKLVGIYDEVTSESNPFSEDSPEDRDGDGFGVVPDESDGASVEDEETESRVVEEDTDAHEDNEKPEEEVTSYEDLTREVPGDEEVVEEVIEEPHDAAEMPTNGGQNGDSEHEPANGFGGVTHEAVDGDIGDHPLPSDEKDKPFLDGFEPSYAADIIMMEWMSVMTVRSDPAGAFKALDYYESIGWISPEVRDYLETVVGGPGVDSHVNPGEVESPAIRDHKMSHSYIKQLKEITEM
jgi:archaellum component FlaD/FlaE